MGRSSPRGGPSRWFALALVASLGAVGAALVSQHGFAMDPCAWCVFSRLVFVAIAVVAAVGLAWRSPGAARALGALGVALALAGIAASLWQHFVASRSGSCNLTLADRIVGWTTLNERLPSVFEARASCADAAVNLLGIPYDVWALAAFAIVGALLATAVARARGTPLRRP